MHHPARAFDPYQQFVSRLHLRQHRGNFLPQVVSRTGFDVTFEIQYVEALAVLGVIDALAQFFPGRLAFRLRRLLLRFAGSFQHVRLYHHLLDVLAYVAVLLVDIPDFDVAFVLISLLPLAQRDQAGRHNENGGDESDGLGQEQAVFIDKFQNVNSRIQGV